MTASQNTQKKTIVIETVFKTSANKDEKNNSAPKRFQVNVELKTCQDFGKKFKRFLRLFRSLEANLNNGFVFRMSEHTLDIFFRDILTTDLNDALMTVLWFISLNSLTFSFNLA